MFLKKSTNDNKSMKKHEKLPNMLNVMLCYKCYVMLQTDELLCSTSAYSLQRLLSSTDNRTKIMTDSVGPDLDQKHLTF